jgi:hypothetical protein
MVAAEWSTLTLMRLFYSDFAGGFLSYFADRLSSAQSFIEINATACLFQ